MKEDEDKKTIELFQKGDKRAFEELVLKYREKSYYIALSFVGNKDEAMDISQEAFIKVYKRINQFESTKAFFPWFYEIIKNTALNSLRKKKSLHNIKILLLKNISDGAYFEPEALEEPNEKSPNG